MSTCYYAYGKAISGKSHVRLHIGSTHLGWRFHFRAHPYLNIFTLDDWLDYLACTSELIIEDEYGRRIELQNLEILMRKTTGANGSPLLIHDYDNGYGGYGGYNTSDHHGFSLI